MVAADMHLCIICGHFPNLFAFAAAFQYMECSLFYSCCRRTCLLMPEGCELHVGYLTQRSRKLFKEDCIIDVISLGSAGSTIYFLVVRIWLFQGRTLWFLILWVCLRRNFEFQAASRQTKLQTDRFMKKRNYSYWQSCCFNVDYLYYLYFSLFEWPTDKVGSCEVPCVKLRS